MHHQLRFLRRNWLAILLAFSTSGCDLDCNPSISSSSGGPPPPTLVYPDSDMRLWATLPAAPNVPTTANFTASSFTIAPALPAGLTFDTGDGAIRGAPTTAQAGAIYRVDALNSAGASQALALVSIEVFEAGAPSAFSYSPNSATVAVGDALAPLIASFSGVVESFSIAPALPLGLSLHPATGVISGTCAGGSGATQHTVTATNPFGSAQADVALEVLAGLTQRGLLVPSAGDLTVDVFDRRGVSYAPIDAVYAGAVPRAVAASRDGRWVFIATSNARLLRCERDPLSARLDEPVDLGDVGSVRQLAISSDRRYLVAAGDGFVTRWDLASDGTVCCAAQTSGPFAPSALLLAGSGLALVGSSSPGQLRVYELEPGLALRGAALELGSTTVVSALEHDEEGVSFYAATSIYNEIASQFTGALRRFSISSASQVQAGAEALLGLQNFAVGRQLTDVRRRSGAAGRELVVLDRSLAQLQVWSVNSAGAFVAGTAEIANLGGDPWKLALGADPDEIWVLDEAAAELRHYDVPLNGSLPSPPMLRARVRTRAQPIALVAVRGPAAWPAADTAFVASAGASTLLALRADPLQIGGVLVSAQGAISTGAAPRAVQTHPAERIVYTANWGAASLGVYSYDANDLALSSVEEEQLSAGARPASIALTPSGRHLHALDENGRVLAFAVDASSGALNAVSGLTVQGSLVAARLCADRLGRFLFVVQPDAGRITSLSVNLPSGFLLIRNFETSLPRPVGLWTSPDGRFAYVLDEQLARVVSFEIDEVSGSLLPFGAGIDLSGAPTRLLSQSPAQTVVSFDVSNELRVLDRSSARVFGVWRNASNGVLPTQPAPVEFEAPIDAWELANLSVGAAQAPFTMLALDGPSGARLSCGYDTPGASQAWIEIDSVPLGAGPHAIATRVTMR